jgi:hypothetical protein
MFDINNPLQNTIYIYLLNIILILYLRPSTFFTTDGNIKSFGIGNNKTLINFPLYIITVGIISYILFTIIKLCNK